MLKDVGEVFSLLVLLLLDGRGGRLDDVGLLLKLLGKLALQRGQRGRGVRRRAVRHSVSDVAVDEPRGSARVHGDGAGPFQRVHNAD